MEALDWTKAAGAVAQIGMLLVAVTALTAWKHQAKAKKQTDFLDELTDAVHEYIQMVAAPLQALKFVRIGIESHSGNYSAHGANAPAIEYIQRRGKEDSTALWDKLNRANEVIARINSLMARGQVYDLQEFSSAANSIKMLLWQHERIQTVALMIGNPHLNWENVHVLRVLGEALSVNPDDIGAHLQKHEIEFIKFVETNYRQIYSDA